MSTHKPEVGQRWEVLRKETNNWIIVKITAIGEEYLLAKSHTATEILLSKDSIFRPIQTETDPLIKILKPLKTAADAKRQTTFTLFKIAISALIGFALAGIAVVIFG